MIKLDGRHTRPVRSHRIGNKPYGDGCSIGRHRATNSDTGFIRRVVENVQSILEGKNK